MAILFFILIKMEVKNFLHKNQFIIDDENWFVTFQSYESKICDINYHTNHLRIYKNRDYSKTTLKHFYAFLREYLGIDLDRKTLLAMESGKIDWYYKGYFITFDENVKAFEKSLKN